MKLGIRDSARKLAQALKRRGWRKARAPFLVRGFLRRRGALAAGRWNAVRLQWRRAAQLPMMLAPSTAAALPRHAGATQHSQSHIHLHIATPHLRARLKTASGKALDCAAVARDAGPGAATRHAPAPHVFAPQAPANFNRLRIGMLSTVISPRAGIVASTETSAVRAAGRSSSAGFASAAASPVRATSMHKVFATRHPELFNVRAGDIGQQTNNSPSTWRRATTRFNAATRQGGAAEVREHTAPAAALWQPQSPALVWRRQPGAQSYARGDAWAANAGANADDSDNGQAATTRRAKPPPAAPVAPTASAIAAQLRATQLDPVLTDRLATEVIRRVERSLRIARERRGY